MDPPPSPWVAAIVRHRHGVLVIALLLTLLSGWRASKLEIDSDLRTLMPAEHPVLTELRRVEQALGHLGALVIVVEGGTSEARRALADAVAAALADHPHVDAVEHRVDTEFVRDHALYYLGDDEVHELQARLDAWQHHALCSRAPDLCLTAPDPQAPARLEALLRAQQDRLARRAGLRDDYDDPERGARLIFVFPSRPSSDVEFDLAVTREVREALEQILARPGPWSGADLRPVVVGPYAAKADETLSLRRDIGRSGLVAALGVGAVLLLVFPSLRVLVALLVPLAVGVAWSLAAAELMLGRLGIMTSLVSTVIMGLGIDAGIHLMTRCRLERRTHDAPEAIARAFGGLMRPLWVATGTTACAFAALATSDFAGFRELGLIATAGVVLCLVAMLTVFPALLAVLGLPPGPRPRRRWLGRWLAARSRGGLGLGLVMVMVVVSSAAALWGAVRLGPDAFERSSRAVQSDAIRRVHEPALATMVGVLGKQVHTAVLVVDGYDAMARTYRRAEARHRARREAGDSVVAELAAAPRLMPPPEVDLARRHAAIEELADSLSERTWARLEGRAGDPGLAVLDPALVDALRRMLRARPFGPQDLPASLVRRFRGRDDAWAIHAHPSFDPADMIGGLALIEETAEYARPEGTGEGMFVGETILYASMVLRMKERWPRLVGLAVISVLAFSAWQLRSPRQAVVTLLPAAVALLWLVGLMSLTELRLTLFNLAVLPIIVGIGVDDGVYLWAALRSTPAGSVSRGAPSEAALDELEHGARAVLATTATTMVGFGALCVADSAGLRGIGWLAVLGIGLATLAALLLVPPLSRPRGLRRR
ncbi:MAG: MMPL family transporter [Myxococcales bacterium]|nr:MMPL family transporter [Myxococcales bacterium]